MTTELVRRFHDVKASIERAALAAGREASSVKLVAVSKGHGASEIRELYMQGQRVFGESYAQELERKAGELRDLEELEWHFIGHVQTNKAKVIAAHASAVHAIDSARAARALDAALRATDRHAVAFVSVNFGLDEKEHGAREAQIPEVRDAIALAERLTLRGYMTLPPDDVEGTERAFQRLREIRDADDPALELSMGMSHDLERAVAHGATLVRIGTALFGARS